MRDFKNGVSYYTIGKLNIEIPFPEKETVCGRCPFVKEEYGLKRHRCLATQEMLYSIESRGRECPIDFSSGEIRD